MAELMVAAGAWSAIELDGGGSSTTVMFLPFAKTSSLRVHGFVFPDSFDPALCHNTLLPALSPAQVFEGRLMNHPTCVDLPFPECERHVNSAVCILE